MIEVRETAITNIKNVQKLWADRDVMRFVGFPAASLLLNKNPDPGLSRLRILVFLILDIQPTRGEPALLILL